ncbi:hypothetical protein SASPL_109528 [Salvia splendens]|uniref:Uncharacterized protein n=1 Tax=Salvia splendens TaxID=180675 RepID=A0A8X8YGP1_SALSN|nr:hypothetical protein SASPL_109528 [Salvia splendens]
MVSSKLMQDRRSKFEQVVSNRVSLAFPTPDLQQVTQELDSAMEQVVKLMEGKKTMLSGASFSHGEVQQLESVNLVEGEEKKMPDLSTSKNDLVGVDADLLQLKDRLPKGISRLNNLQTLICPHRIPYVTSELGGMSELRHIRLVMAVIEIQEIQFDIKKMHTLFHA